MIEQLKLMCVFAHPDDESLGTGGTLAKYSAEGVETYVVTATRGERGWFGDEKDYPGVETLGKIREAELLAAANVLGVREVSLLDYVDGDLDQAEPTEVIGKIVKHVRRVRPQVVITFDPFGSYGHPDHIAISQFTTAAIVCAADPGYEHANGSAPHRVSKLYYMADNKTLANTYQSLFGDISMNVDGTTRLGIPWEDWAITTWIDAEVYWRTAWQAIQCHQSQITMFQARESEIKEYHSALIGQQTFYRAFSTVNGGRKMEHDLFEGVR
jgi:LmbE family N-acetylglucosaminyl deacetylase